MAVILSATSLGFVPAPAGAATGTGSWVPPQLTDPTTVHVTDSARTVQLDPARDYVVTMPPTPITRGGVKIQGGRNVVMYGGEIRLDGQGPDAQLHHRRGLLLEHQTGTVHIEGLLMGGADLTEGIQIAAPQATVQLVNTRIEGVSARDTKGWSDNTPDLVQPWGGVKELRIDGFTGTTDYRGFLIKGDSGPIGRVDLRRVNLKGGLSSQPLLTVRDGVPVTAEQVWVEPPAGSTRDAMVVPAPPDTTWDAVGFGRPYGGDFVKDGAVGIGYERRDAMPLAPAPSAGIEWPAPALSNPSTILVGEDNRDVVLEAGRDYVIKMPSTPLVGTGGLKITGGRHVVLIGGTISIPWQGPDASVPARRGLLVQQQTGTVHIEGLHITGSDLTEGIQIAAPEATVQIQNVRIDEVRARDKVGFTDNHPDLIQPWGGVKALRVGGFTGTSDYQGFFLRPEAPIGKVELRRVNLIPTPTARVMLWHEGTYPVTVSEVYVVRGPSRTWATTIEPRLPSPVWAGVREGFPPHGDFVPAGFAGVGYEPEEPVAAPAVPSLSVADTSVVEPISGTRSVCFVVTLSAPTGAPVHVDFSTVDGTAKAPADYEARSGTLRFQPGETRKEVWVPVLGDDVAEGDEVFDLRLSRPLNALVARGAGRATVSDPVPALSVADVTVREGVGSAAVEVVLSTPSWTRVRVGYATSTGSAGADDFSARSGTLEFARGQRRAVVKVPITQDTVHEREESFWFKLSAPTGGATLARATARVTIVDDDPAPTMSALDVSMPEGDYGSKTCKVVVRLSNRSDLRPTVKWTTVDGTAKAGSDYRAASGQLTFYPSDIERTIFIDVHGDLVPEKDERFTVKLSSPTDATIARAVATCTIVNDD